MNRSLSVAGLMVMALMLLFPALVGAAPPAPVGKLVFEDDFSDPNKSKLENNIGAQDYSRGFHAPGVYHLKDVKPGETHWSILPNQSYANGTVEIDAYDNSDSFTGDVAQGLLFRAQDATHFYAVLIDPRTGKYTVRKLDGTGKWTDLIAPKASTLIKKLSDINHLRIDAVDDSFTIYLNGESLDSFSDAAYKKGGVGLIASNVDANGMHMHFDNLKIYSSDATAAGSSNVAGTPKPGTLPNTGDSSAIAAPWLVLCGLALLLFGLKLRRTHT